MGYHIYYDFIYIFIIELLDKVNEHIYKSSLLIMAKMHNHPQYGLCSI